MGIDVTLQRWNGTSKDDIHPTTNWGQIESKPSTFTPTAHPHNASDINAGTLGVDRIPTLAQSKITDLVTDLAAKALKTNSVYYVEGNTTGTNGQWTGTISDITALYDGLTIRYRMGIAGADPTYLNINGYGNKQVWRYAGAKHTTHWPAGSIITLTYRASEGYWYNDADYDSTDDYNIRWQGNLIFGEATQGYHLLMEGIDGRFIPVTSGGDGASTTNTISSAELRVDGLMIYYGSSTDYAVGATGAAYYLYESIYSNEMEYWSNKASGWAVANKPFYIVCTMNANGNFVLDGAGTTGNQFLTQTLPTTDDSKYYIQVGFMHNTYDAWRLDVSHPIYQYKDGKLRLYVPEHKHVKADITDFPASMPASDVYSWAKSSTKPSYTQDEVTDGSTYKRVTQTEKNTWNAKEPAITKGSTSQYFRGDMSLATFPASMPASDVYSWAKSSTKPTYTQDEVVDGGTYVRVTPAEKSTWNGKVTANTAITGATKPKITYDAKGLVTGGADLAAADIPSLDWAKITTGKPTTLSGYGITDAAANNHAHGNITNDGKIGTTANRLVITTTNGAVTTLGTGTEGQIPRVQSDGSISFADLPSSGAQFTSIKNFTAGTASNGTTAVGLLLTENLASDMIIGIAVRGGNNSSVAVQNVIWIKLGSSGTSYYGSILVPQYMTSGAVLTLYHFEIYYSGAYLYIDDAYSVAISSSGGSFGTTTSVYIYDVYKLVG